MKQTRKEHIVPRMLLSRFADSEGLIWVYEKGKRPRRSKPENECCQRDFFEYEIRGRKTNNTYENWLERNETAAGPLLDAILRRRLISRQQAEIWAVFVAALFGRTRKVRAQVSAAMKSTLQQRIDDPGFIRDFQYSLLQRGELHYASALKLSLERWRDDMNASDSYFHVSGLPERTRTLASDLLERDWHTLEAADGQCFLMSDCPVVTVECCNGSPRFGVGFGNKDAAILLPISPRHLFVASPHHVKWKAQLDSAGVECVNREIAHFAHRNVYANGESQAVKALVDSEIDKVVFGQNAFVPPQKIAGS